MKHSIKLGSAIEALIDCTKHCKKDDVLGHAFDLTYEGSCMLKTYFEIKSLHNNFTSNNPGEKGGNSIEMIRRKFVGYCNRETLIFNWLNRENY